jgi:hypothetical protein
MSWEESVKRYNEETAAAKAVMEKIFSSDDVIEAIKARVDLNNPEYWVNMESFVSELETGLGYFWNKEADDEFNKRLKAYPIATWLCTDSVVGYYAYYFDGYFIAMSTQMGRKCDKNFIWISKEKALEVRDYILELYAKHEEVLENIQTFSNTNFKE